MKWVAVTLRCAQGHEWTAKVTGDDAEEAPVCPECGGPLAELVNAPVTRMRVEVR